MTATPDSIILQVLGTLGRDWEYAGSPQAGAVNFRLDDKAFTMFVVETEGFETVFVMGDPTFEEYPLNDGEYPVANE